MLPESETPQASPRGNRQAEASPEASLGPIWTAYFDGRPLEISRPFEGYTLDEWRHGGKSFYQRVFTLETYRRLREVTRLIRGTHRAQHNVSISLRAKDGSHLQHYLVNYFPVFDLNNEVIAIRGEARDVTELRDVQKAFGHDFQLVNTLLENTPDVIWLGYLDGQRGYANRGFGGYSATEWAEGGLDFLTNRLTLESRRRFERAISYLKFSGEIVRSLELEFCDVNETSRRRLQATFSPLFDRDEVVVGVQGMLRDVSELMQTRAALNRSQTRFREMIDNAHDLVWTINRACDWEYVNQAAKGCYGYAPDDMIGRPYTDFVHPDYRDKDLKVFDEVLRGREVPAHETVHLHQDGSLRYLTISIRPRLDENWEVTGAMGMARDVTEQKTYQQQLEHLADHDVLTGLHNRHYFERELERTVARVARQRDQAGLIYIDLDNFKYVNDTLGHAVGDRLLLEVAQLLLGRLRQGDVVARFGGDEFTVLMHNMNHELLAHVMQSFHQLFENFTFFEGQQVFDIRVSLGATLIKPDTQNSGEALAQADLACTLAKSRGRNQTHLYDPADQALADMVSDVSWTRRINEALEHGQFVLHFQPIFPAQGGDSEHFEVLLRMRTDDNLIAPGLFLPSAERFGLIQSIDRWVVLQSIETLRTLHRTGRKLRFAINLSARVFEDKDFLPFLRDGLRTSGLEPSNLIFEITETSAISHMASAGEFIEQLKLLGCSVALDDFGSGFSSYGYLKHLPVDYLKIDGSFVQQLARDTQDQAIVRSMNQVAHALGKRTVAEYVEDADSLAVLRAIGVDYVQGFHLGRPDLLPPPGSPAAIEVHGS